jgi:A/G-specific adenine glycosylase
MNDAFITVVWEHYISNKRSMPWRSVDDLSIKDRGYRILVSEVMLQQTQVSRVVSKYQQWMLRWPTIDDACNATLAEVLVLWSGLGYNRRAKYLHESLRRIQKVHSGIVPNNISELQALPGIGPNTAAAIIVYTYNVPISFIETNIRTVYIDAFFADTDTQVTDKQIIEKVHSTMDTERPREWFYALMDYGAYLKKSQRNHLSQAAAHKKQSVFKDSNRQLRGRVLRLLTEVHSISTDELVVEFSDNRIHSVITDLLAEGLIVERMKGVYQLPTR